MTITTIIRIWIKLTIVTITIRHISRGFPPPFQQGALRDGRECEQSFRSQNHHAPTSILGLQPVWPRVGSFGAWLACDVVP